ncbi:MAG: radical SAM protein, partial [uncultured bacterium]
LDSLPMPAWDLLPEYPFLYSPSLASGAGTKPTGSLFTTRGCPWRCKFCDRGVFGDNLRQFSAKYVMKQILHLYHTFGVRELMFGDDTLFVDKERMKELAQLMIDAKLNLRWECMSRVVDADPELYELVKQAGCFEVSYGIESADDRISQMIFKPINQKSIRLAIDITKQAGIRARGYFIFGLPGETSETLETTRRFILNSGLDDVAIFSCTPYPGSALYKMADQYGTFEPSWGNMNNVKTVFVPHGLTAEYIEKLRQKTMRQFYMNPKFLWKWGKRIIKDEGWSELKGRGGLYARFLTRFVTEALGGLGRGA